MAHFHIEGLRPFDGDYPIDFESFTNGEYHLIKKISGVRAGEISEAFEAGDNDLIVAFAAVALQRAGNPMDKQALDVLWGAEFGKIELVVDEDEEADASPPASPPPSEPVASESGTVKNGSSGAGSSPAGDSPASDLSPTGRPLSAAGAESVPRT